MSLVQSTLMRTCRDRIDWCILYWHTHTVWFTDTQKSHPNPKNTVHPTNTTAFLRALNIGHSSSISLVLTGKHTKTPPMPLLSWQGEVATPSSKKNSSDSCSYRLRPSVGLLPMFFHGNTMLMCDLYGVIYSVGRSKRDKHECNKDIFRKNCSVCYKHSFLFTLNEGPSSLYKHVQNPAYPKQ